MKIAVRLTHPIVEAWRFQPRHVAQFQAGVPGAEVVVCESPDALMEALPDTDVAAVWSFKQDWFYLAPHLKLLATPAAGRDFFSVQPPAGVEQFYGSFHGQIMAETVLGMLLGAHRGVLPAADLMRAPGDDPWPREELAPSMRTLRGSHLVILGFGHIGQWVGRLAKPFGVRVTGVKSTKHGERPDYFDAGDQIVAIDQLDDLLGTSDSLVCSLPGGDVTAGILGAERLALLPDHAVLVNVGRGNAIDERALTVRLAEGHLAAACLDVFAKEPLSSESPLRRAPRCYLMPHTSAIAPNYLDLFIDELAVHLRHG